MCNRARTLALQTLQIAAVTYCIWLHAHNNQRGLLSAYAMSAPEQGCWGHQEERDKEEGKVSRLNELLCWQLMQVAQVQLGKRCEEPGQGADRRLFLHHS